MKILFVSHTYPRWAGDRAGAQVLRFAQGATARDHEVLVVAPHAAGAAVPEEVLDGVRVRRFRYASDAGERIGYQGAISKSLGSPAALLTLPKYFLRFKQAVRAAVTDFRPDVASVHWWAPAAIATDGLPCPIAITCHGSDVRLLGSSLLVRTIGRPILRRATAVSAVSEMMAGDIRTHTGRGAVAVTRMPVEDSLFVPAATRDAPPVVLFAGNIIRAKGVDLILHAAARLQKEGVSFRLRLVGDGPDRAAFGALTASLGIAGIVEWAGAKGHNEMPAEFAAASVFVLASRGPRGEGLPLTVVEALLSGCAVVATPAGGVPEIVVDEVTGLIARDEDVAHLTAQLGRLVSEPGLRERLGTAGRIRALEQHGAGPAMERFFAFLTAAAEQGRGR